jgi:DNA repair exonuclease SbcCD ATPase subunit
MSLRIRQLKLKGIRQFRDVTFDFTDPKTGKPLDRICLIGGNGTGNPQSSAC